MCVYVQEGNRFHGNAFNYGEPRTLSSEDTIGADGLTSVSRRSSD